MQAQLESLSNARDDMKVRKIDLPRGGSAAGSDFQIRSIPHLLLYKGGEEVATGTQAVRQMLSSL